MTHRHRHTARHPAYALMIAAAMGASSSLVHAAETIDNEVRAVGTDTTLTDITVGGFGRIDVNSSTLTLLGGSTIQPGASSGANIQAVGISGSGNIVVGESGTTSSLVIERNTTFSGTTEVKADATVTLEDTSGLGESSSITVRDGGTLINKAGGAEVDAVIVEAGGTLDLRDSLFIGVDGGSSTLAGTLKSALDSGGSNPSLVIKGNTTITSTNAEFGASAQVRDDATLTLTSIGAIGEADDTDFGRIQIAAGSTLVSDAADAIDVGRELRMASEFGAGGWTNGAVWQLNADQTIARLDAAVNTDIQIADGATLTVNTAADPSDGSDTLHGNISGSGNLGFSGDGELYIAPEMEFTGLGGQTSFTGATTVNGGGKLYLTRTDALGGSSELLISGGSEVILHSVAEDYDEEALTYLEQRMITIPGATNPLNTDININLDAIGNTDATLDVRVDQTVNEVATGTNGTITVADGATFTINGDVTGNGAISLTGSGNTTIAATSTLSSGATLGNEASLTNNGTMTADEETVAATFDGSGDSTTSNLTITNTGTIETDGSGDQNNAVYLKDSDQVTINNSGTIEADGATGIHLKGSVGANIDNSGQIIAGGNNAVFIEDSTNATITNNGTIRSGNDDGIDLENSSGATVTNMSEGTIIADDDHGIQAKNSTNANFVNNGKIIAEDNDGINLPEATSPSITNAGSIIAKDRNAIYAHNSTNANFINTGTILAEVDDGIDLGDATSPRITNAGSITAKFNNGIYAPDSTNANFINTGTILAEDNDGIDLGDATSPRITNDGTIAAKANNGIFARRSTDANFVNNGTIIASKDDGIDLLDAKSPRVTNNGTITAEGDNGIQMHGVEGAIITNTGTITATRKAIDAADSDDPVTDATFINTGTLRAEGNTIVIQDSSTLRNSGTIEATKAGENAIYARGTDTVVILEPGSRIIGDVESTDASNTLRLNLTSAGSVIYQTTGDWTLESVDGQPLVEGSVISAGVGNLETADELMHRRSMDLQASLRRLTAQREHAGEGHPVLVDLYAGDETRESHRVSGSTIPEYDLESTGLTLATLVGVADRPIQLFAIYSNEELDIDTGTHQIEAEGVRLGAATDSLFELGPFNIGARLVLGRHEYDGDREVLINDIGSSGVIRQESEWQSDTWEAGINARYQKAVSPAATLTVTPSLSVHQERIEAYRESDEFSWDSRNVTQGRAAVDTAFAYKAGARTDLNAGIKLWHREILDGETAEYTLSGTDVSYTDPVHEDQGFSANAGFQHRLNDVISISAEAAGHWTVEETDGWQLSLSMMAQF